MPAAAKKLEPDLAPEPPPLIAAEIALRMQAAEAELAELETHVGNVVLDAEIGTPGAADNLVLLNQQISDAGRRVSQLRAAHETAQARDAATLARHRHELRQRTLVDFESAVKRRLDAAKKLAPALAQATTAYRAFIEAQDGLARILPLDVTFDHGELGAIHELNPQRLAATEMWRLGVHIGENGMANERVALPGAHFDNIQTMNDPDSIPPLIGRVEASTEWLLEAVRGRVAALGPPATPGRNAA